MGLLMAFEIESHMTMRWALHGIDKGPTTFDAAAAPVAASRFDNDEQGHRRTGAQILLAFKAMDSEGIQ